MISFNSSGDMGGVNERPSSTAQSSLLRDALVSGLDGKKRKVRTFGSDNIIIPEKLASRNGDKVPKKKRGNGGRSTRQTNESAITPIPSQSVEFSIQNLLPDSLTRHFPDAIMWTHRTCSLP